MKNFPSPREKSMKEDRALLISRSFVTLKESPFSTRTNRIEIMQFFDYEFKYTQDVTSSSGFIVKCDPKPSLIDSLEKRI